MRKIFTQGQENCAKLMTRHKFIDSLFDYHTCSCWCFEIAKQGTLVKVAWFVTAQVALRDNTFNGCKRDFSIQGVCDNRPKFSLTQWTSARGSGE